ncbi:MAG TPA: hypothetical protein VHJ83_14960 [Micromonosporaceae bacterium]|nr:hypothetical protein [Micromonosporaceae bacterium]
MDVVGVHGIGLSRKPIQVWSRWREALDQGLAANVSGEPPLIDFQLAWYRRLFLGPNAPGQLKGPLDIEDAPISPEEAEFLTEVTEEHAAAEGITIQELNRQWKGLVPAPLRPLVAVLARRIDFDWAIGAVPVLRQVWRYLHDDVLAAQIRAVVAQAMGSGSRTLLAHSLGSVVAYETLAFTGPPGTLWPGTLVTMGSPLSLKAVRARLRARPPRPALTWVNVYDPGDPVVATGGLSQDFSAVREYRVDNGRRAHSVRRYLSSPKTGGAVIEAVRPLQPAAGDLH